MNRSLFICLVILEKLDNHENVCSQTSVFTSKICKKKLIVTKTHSIPQLDCSATVVQMK